jgi:hypothetical protein
MKNIISPIFILFCINRLLGQTPINDPHWQLVKNWDFKTINWTDFTNDWNISPCVRALDHKGKVEPQFYSGNNVSLNTDGVHLIVKNQSVYEKIICYQPNTYKLSDDGDNLRWSYFTSGWIETKPTFYKKYGYIEAKIKAPYGYNFFPAFWTFVGDGVNGTNGAEIDVFEFLPGDPYNQPLYPNNFNIIKTNVHLKYPPEDDPFRGLDLAFIDYRNFNTYGIEWTPSRITWFINDIPVRYLDNPGVNDYVKVIINLALNPWNSNSSLTPLPSDMVIEFVKFYDYRKDCSTVINSCSYNFTTYDNKVKKEIIIGGNGCSNSISSSQNIILRASDGITINGDFTVPVGGQLYLDANKCY